MRAQSKLHEVRVASVTGTDSARRAACSGSWSGGPSTDARSCLHSAKGFALIEVMVTIVLLTIGLVGLAALQIRTSQLEMESYQRTQALLLAQDMADRMAANKPNAGLYVGDDYGSGAATGCGGLNGYALDLCAWSNSIRGTTERSGVVNIGTLLSGRGCIEETAAGRYQVTVAWQGLLPTSAPAADCGVASFGDEATRRAVVVPIRFANLRGA